MCVKESFMLAAKGKCPRRWGEGVDPPFAKYSMPWQKLDFFSVF